MWSLAVGCVLATACAAPMMSASAAAPQEPPRSTPAQEPVRLESAPAAAPAAPAVEPAGAFRIGPEDVLDVQVWKNAELSRVVPVRPDGMISLPLVNDIRAAGLTPVELRQQITLKLSEFVPSPEVSVIVREVHSVKVAVLGVKANPVKSCLLHGDRCAWFSQRAPRPNLHSATVRTPLGQDQSTLHPSA